MITQITIRLIALGTILSLSLVPFLAKAESANLNINFPNGGESLEQRNIYPFQWSGVASGVTLSLVSGENDKNIFLIATVPSQAAEHGVYLWTVPTDLPVGQNYRLIIEDGTGTVLGASDRPFNIIKPIETKQAKVNQLANIFQILENILNRWK